MTSNPRIREIKHAQRESFLLKEISALFHQITIDEPRLKDLIITRVSLSANRGQCTVYFYTPGGLKEFEEKRDLMVLFKPSLRGALSKALQTRYTPDLRFKYDQKLEKQRRIDDLIQKLKDEGNL